MCRSSSKLHWFDRFEKKKKCGHDFTILKCPSIYRRNLYFYSWLYVIIVASIASKTVSTYFSKGK